MKVDRAPHKGGRSKATGPLRLAQVIRKWRLSSDIGLEECADMIGINYKALYRLERGASVDMQSTVKIITWLMAEIDATTHRTDGA